MTKAQAVIEIGSTGIRLLVADIKKENTFQAQTDIIDKSEFPVALGRDVFTTGAIKRETLIQSINILNRYAEQLKAWGISQEETTVIATSAVREANNRDPFVDRVRVKTGFTVRVIDGIEENRLMYIAVKEALRDKQFSTEKSDAIIMEIAGGTTELMLLSRGRMVAAHSMRLGTVIIEQKAHSLLGNLEDARRYVEEFVRSTKATLSTETDLKKLEMFIAISGDIKIAAKEAGLELSPFLWEITRSQFEDFVEKTRHFTLDEVMAKFALNYQDAQSFQISLMAYDLFIKITGVQNIIVPDTSIREGLLISHMKRTDEELQTSFSEQVVASAKTLLSKYQGDEKHAEYVRRTSLKIFDAMKNELGLDKHARMLLEVSSILHDIGMFIRAQDHNMHSKYIIENSEIFGLTHEDITILASIAAYHKGTKLPMNDPEIKMLPRHTRMTILKLSAILRLSDAFDRGHQQRLKDFNISFAKDSITFRVKGTNNLALEKLAVAEKGGLFESVFGYKIVLV